MSKNSLIGYRNMRLCSMPSEKLSQTKWKSCDESLNGDILCSKKKTTKTKLLPVSRSS